MTKGTKISNEIDMGGKPAICKRMFRASEAGYLSFNVDRSYAVVNVEGNKMTSYVVNKGKP